GLVDPGGSIGQRVERLSLFGLFGAAVTALGFGLGRAAWGWLVVASFLVTFVASLAGGFGAHRFVGALFRNLWFFLAGAVGNGLHQHTLIANHTWAQVVAWVAGSGFWIVVMIAAWAVRGGREVPTPVPELPGDTARRKLSRPLILFAGIRAVAIGGAVAIAFG